MTKTQRLALERSEVRSKLNELNAAETVDIAEVRRLSADLGKLEKRWREAARAEAEAAPAADGEAREHRALARRSRLGRFLAAAAFGDGRLDGVEAEYRSALGLKDRHIPIDLLAPETRGATVPAAGDQAQTMHPALDRIFARSDTAFLGVRIESVAPGQPVYPVVTAGPSAGFEAKDAATGDGDVTISATKISPSRLTVSTSWAVEDEAAFGEVEGVVRRDLSAAMSDALDDAVLTGDGTAPNLAGFFDADSGLAAPAGAQLATAVNTFDTYAQQLSAGIDGLNAYALSDLKVLVGVDTIRHMEGLFRGNDGPISAASYLSGRLSGLRASKRVPAVASKKQDALVARMNGAAVLAVWKGVEAIRDPYSDARKGGVRLTLCALYGFEVVRNDGWYRTRFQLKA